MRATIFGLFWTSNFRFPILVQVTSTSPLPHHAHTSSFLDMSINIVSMAQSPIVPVSSLSPKDKKELFDLVAQLVRETPAERVSTSNQDKLRLYGLYKHVTEGPCSSSEDIAGPSVFQLVARSKIQAWMDCRGLTTQQAMLEYIDVVASRGDTLGQQCQDIVKKFTASRIDDDSTGSSEGSQPKISQLHDDSPSELPGNGHQLPITSDGSRRNIASSTLLGALLGALYGWISSFFIQICLFLGVRPLLPRGRLDIACWDLCYALWQCCLWWQWTPYHCQKMSRQIRHVWNEAEQGSGDGLITGLSVRSILDLYLCTKKFPDGSQVIVAPPISVPGMMHVLQFHKLEVVPIDLPTSSGDDDRSSSWCNCGQIEDAITSKTVAIMIVHPFGMMSVSSEQMQYLRKLSDEHGIDIWEDCAECFIGLGANNDCYKGNPLADIRFFSFGMIKTSTALGGGVAIFRNPSSCYDVEQLQQSLPQSQTTFQFLRRVLLAMVLNCIADSSWRVGVLAKVCSVLRMEFDHLVTHSLRGFRMQPTKKGETRHSDQMDLIYQIRKRPSYALLALLLRRLSQLKNQTASSVRDRIHQCTQMETRLSRSIPDAPLPYSRDLLNTYWAFPVRCQNRDVVSRNLAAMGFDVVSGASQLCCVTSFTADQDSCPNASNLMDSILYLPIASQRLLPADLERLGDAVDYAIKMAETMTTAGGNSDCLLLQGPPSERSWMLGMASLLPVLILPIYRIGLLKPIQLILYMGTVSLVCMTAGTLFALLCLYILHSRAARLYLEGSTAFAEHSDMIDAATSQEPDPDRYTQSGNAILSRVQALQLMEPSPVSGGRTIVLTGATGFIGSMMLRDLLLQREALSLGQVILICRGKKGETSASRISTLLQKPMFSFLSDYEKETYVEVLTGDVTQPSAGLSGGDLRRILDDPTIFHVFHCAAAVGFTQELPDAARSNITSALTMQALTSRLSHKAAQFVHISTAFVHGGRCGSKESPLPEDLFPLGTFDAGEIYRSMLGTQFYASKAMTELGFPNSYTLSKCVCEHLLLRQKTTETLIIRPSIVGPAVESPFEGWAGEKPTTIVAGACLHLLNQWNIWYLEPNSVSHIPVDVLSRFIVVKAFGETKEVNPVNADTASSSDGSFEKLSRASSETFSEFDETSSTSSKYPSTLTGRRIFNATWGATSESSTFTWLEFSVGYLQLGCILGYFDRSLAYLTLLISAQLTPCYCSKDGAYEQLHSILVRGPIKALIWGLGALSFKTSHIEKVLPFLDLPLLFFPFVRRNFYFHSELVAPIDFDAKRYVFSTAVAAHRFISERSRKPAALDKSESSPGPPSMHKIGGAIHKQISSDFWWASSQPRGTFAVRLSAWSFTKILRHVCSVVTVDIVSIRTVIEALRNNNQYDQTYLILAPTHRSLFDFILLSFAVFALPELQLDIPYIIAADDFEQLPFVGWFAKKLRALYIRRGRGQEDPALNDKLSKLKDGDLLAKGASIEVFLEGTRSRDRRFVEPKTGLLKSLDLTGGNHVVVPIIINYERIPEQANLTYEASGCRRGGLKMYSLVIWLKDVILGRVELGKVHISAGEATRMECETREDFAAFALEIQKRQQDSVLVSDYHIRAASALFSLPASVVADAMAKLGCNFWPAIANESPLPLPSNKSELMSIVLQAGHNLAPLFRDSHPVWSQWLNHHQTFEGRDDSSHLLDENTAEIHKALARFFDSASFAVAEAEKSLRTKGFEQPDSNHVLQIAQSINKDRENFVPDIFIHAAVQVQKYQRPTVEALDGDTVPATSSMAAEIVQSNGDQERLGFWGFSDSGFVVKKANSGQSVTMTGDKYDLCGRLMTKLLPFIESEMNIKIDPLHEFPLASSMWSTEMESNLNTEDICFLKSKISLVSTLTQERVRHGTGHSQEDVFAIRSGASSLRIPDAVVWPTSEDDVLALIHAAKERGWCLIPFGGGTNVSNATRCPGRDVEPRPIISVDMREMKRIIWIDEVDGLAHIEAGITGRHLVQELERRGYTMGHEPDSIEFSTLGGWIATKASGMKRSRYGNIEDIVKSAKAITSTGILWKGSEKQDVVPGRVAEGMDIRSLFIGSEGCLGIVTSAVIRIWRLPEVRKFDSIVFPCFEDGLNFARAIAKYNGFQAPSSVRLLDNAHFRLGQSLRPDDGSVISKAKEVFTKIASSAIRGNLDENSVVCATIGYEGSHSEVLGQEATIKRLAAQFGGIRLGSRVGKAGYDLTFMIAYLRDFAMTYHVLGESFETFAPWSKIEKLVSATKNRIREEHRARLLPGIPFVGCRVTQLYHEGACLYFYLCISFDGVKNASTVYSALETAARDEILKQGGSLSHHHGIGKHRASQLTDRMSSAFQTTLNNIKHSVDEDNIFGARNGPFAFSD